MKIRAIILFLSLTFFSCVGPPEPERGLIENLPEVYSSEIDFSFLLLADNFNYKTTFPVEFSQDSTLLSYTVLMVVSESKSTPGSLSNVNLEFNSPGFQDTVLTIRGNKESVYNKIVATKNAIPDSINFDLISFSGLLEFNLIAHRESSGQIGQ